MLARLWSAAARGAGTYLVRVEADLAGGLPRFCVVGLAEGAVRESRTRVAAAVRNAGYVFPDGRLTVGLAPAELKKEGAQLDLPMALGVLAVSGQLVAEPWGADALILGELGLDGAVLPAKGVLALAAAGRERGLRWALVAPANAREAALGGLSPVPVATLAEAAAVLGRPDAPLALPAPEHAPAPVSGTPDLADVRGQALARRALELSAAGGHNLLMVGPPGSGKSMLAARLPGLMPELSGEEAVEVTKLHSLAGLVAPGSGLVTRRPFRAPQSAARPQALLGGGPHDRPGELALAHRGVLFLDELPEFHRDTLECLRLPLEERVVRLARAGSYSEFPADCAVVAAMNPCKCGKSGMPQSACRCPWGAPERYRGRVSGPLLDRLDIRVQLASVHFADWAGRNPASPESTTAVRERVLAARAVAARRLGRPGVTNARLDSAEVRRHCELDRPASNLIETLVGRQELSGRGIDRVLRVARTIADLA
ncbi:ATP-binding protein, partial [bacterium]